MLQTKKSTESLSHAYAKVLGVPIFFYGLRDSVQVCKSFPYNAER